jgi:hypothetical protein
MFKSRARIAATHEVGFNARNRLGLPNRVSRYQKSVCPRPRELAAPIQPRVDSAPDVQHAGVVVRMTRRLAALIMSVLLVAGAPVVCAGWLPTPEARMDCCTNGDPCPMHEPSRDHDGGNHVITQDEADRCCASSERQRGETAPSAAATASIPHPAIAVTPLPFTPSVVVTAHLPEVSPSALLPHVPTYLLLSVILV